MPRADLKGASVAKLTAVDGKRTEYFDESLPGFSVRVSASGRKSFSVLYRSGRRLRRYTLGRYPVIGLARARELARAALAEANGRLMKNEAACASGASTARMGR